MQSDEAPASRSNFGPLLALLACGLILQFLFLCEARLAAEYGMAMNGWRDGIRQLFEPLERVFGAFPRDEGDAAFWRTTLFLAFHAVAFAVFGLASWLALKRLPGSRVALALILLGAIGFRAALVFSPPLLENSINRYIWDGVVTSMGINPFRYSPREIMEARDATKRAMYPEPQRTELLHLSIASRDEFNTAYHFKYVTYPELRTIYPPLAQLYFGTAMVVKQGSQDTLKLFNAIVDLAALALVLALLLRMGHDPNACIVYAWSPIVVKEFTNSGHVDVLAGFFTLAALLYVIGKRPALAGAAIAMGALVKVYPLVLGVVFWKRLGRVGLVVLAGVVLIGLTPQATETDLRYQGFAAYARHWEANSSLVSLVSHTLQFLRIEEPPPTPGSTKAATMPARRLASRVVSLAILALLLLRISMMPQETGDDLARMALYAVGAMILCSPVVLPWYVAWMCPLLALYASPAAHAMTVTVHLWYAAKILVPEGIWYNTVHETLRFVEYAPVFWLLWRELRKK